MAKIRCPQCGSQATELAPMLMLHRAAYCVHCGWNVPATAAKLRTSTLGLLILSAIGLLLMFVAVTRGHQGWTGALAIGVPFFFLPAALVIVAQTRLSRITRSGSQTNSDGEVFISPADGIAGSDADPLRFSSRPRAVRMSWPGRLYAIAVMAVTASIVWLISLSAPQLLHPPAGSVFTSFLGVGAFCWWLWSCVAFFRKRIRERNLFANGDIATGTVLWRRDGRYGPYIVYSFRTANGNSVQTRCRDYSNDQFEQMPLHVFYDPIDPSRNVALESSLYRVS
jgi:hypothetical protein